MNGHLCLDSVEQKLGIRLLLVHKAFFNEIPDDFSLDWVDLSDNEPCFDQVTGSDQVDPTADLNHVLPLECLS